MHPRNGLDTRSRRLSRAVDFDVCANWDGTHRSIGFNFCSNGELGQASGTSSATSSATLARRVRTGLVLAILAALLATVCYSRISHLAFLRTTVYNLSDPAMFEAAQLPAFVQQSPDAVGLINFRRHTSPLVNPDDDDLTRIVKIQHWVRSQERDLPLGRSSGPMVDGTEDPEQYLDEQKRGLLSVCRRYAYILTGALLSQGINARVVSLAANFDRHSPTAHNVVEAWLPSLNQWIMLDPTFDAVVLVDGHPASALEVHEASRPGWGSRLSLDQHCARYRAPPISFYRNYFNHIFVARTNALFDGYRYGWFASNRITFAHYTGPGVEPFPERRKNVLLLGLAASSVIAVGCFLRTIALLATLALESWKQRQKAGRDWGTGLLALPFAAPAECVTNVDGNLGREPS